METETKKETAEYKDVESQIIDSPEGEFRIPEGADIDVSVSETPDKKLSITETVTVDEHEYLECEKRWVFLLLMMVGGFFGGFTYSVRGGVFCNAQTANFVLMAVQLGQGNWRKALYYLLPASAYLLGTIISEFLPKHINRRKIVRWDTAFVAFEMVWIFALGFVPDSAPPQICQVAVNFIASMQFNTFRQAKKIPMATTFCTNHVRQVGSNLVKWLRSGNKEARGKMFAHLLMIGSFIAGAVASAFICGYLGGKTIWCADILLLIVFFALLRADLGEEHDKLDVVPHGH